MIWNGEPKKQTDMEVKKELRQEDKGTRPRISKEPGARSLGSRGENSKCLRGMGVGGGEDFLAPL